MTASTLRNRIYKKAGTNKVPLIINDDEGPLEFELRELSVDGRAAVLESATKADEDGARTVDQAQLIPAVLIACVYDPATGAPLFTEADREAIGQMSASFVDQLFKPAAKLSGLLDEDREEIAGNSGATKASASASPSPAN